MLFRRYEPGDERRVDNVQPRTIDRLLPLTRVLEGYFRYSVVGLENVPTEGPGLITMNHGFLPVDAILLGAAIYRKQRRLVRALTDHLVFDLPGLREVFMTIGAVDGNMELGHQLLDSGNLVIVMPGGAPEAFKPTSRAYELMWGERRGFVRLAMATGAPIVPSFCMGIDELYVILNDSFATGKKVFGVRSMPLPVGFGLGALPLPVKLTSYVGPAIPPPGPPEAAEDPALVEEFWTAAADGMAALRERAMADRAQEPRLLDSLGQRARRWLTRD